MAVQITDNGKLINIDRDGIVNSIPKSGTQVKVANENIIIDPPTGTSETIAFADVTVPTVTTAEELRDAVVALINGPNIATISSAVTLSNATAITILSANSNRINMTFSNPSNKAVWLKEQTASTDNDKKGIHIFPRTDYESPPGHGYTGEYSAIADNGTPAVYITEY